jgi:hypothetical protein
MKKQISLYTAIQGEYELTEEDKQQIYDLLTYRCRRKTKDDIMGRLNYIMCQPASALFERVIKEEFSDGSTKWVMIAGQDYNEQMKDTRNLLLGR